MHVDIWGNCKWNGRAENINAKKYLSFWNDIPGECIRVQGGREEGKQDSQVFLVKRQMQKKEGFMV